MNLKQLQSLTESIAVPVKELLDKIDHGFSWMFQARSLRPSGHVARRSRATSKPFDPCADRADPSVGHAVPRAVRAGPALSASRKAPAEDLDSEHFIKTLEALTRAPSCIQWSKFEVFTNGENFYEAELAAIRQAKKSINLEAYIFAEGRDHATSSSRRWPSARGPACRSTCSIDAIGACRLTKGYFQAS